MEQDGTILKVIVFFLIWIIILGIIAYAINYFANKNKHKSSKIKVPAEIKPATSKYKTLFMRCYIPSGMDPNSQKAAETKLRICQNLYIANGKVSNIKTNSNGTTAITIKMEDISFVLPSKLRVPLKVDEKVIVFYEKGMSGIPHYITTIKHSELLKITQVPSSTVKINH